MEFHGQKMAHRSLNRPSIAESFDFAKPCEAALAEHRKKALQIYKVGAKAPNAEFWNRFYLTAAGEASCIATDDPPLKQKTTD